MIIKRFNLRLFNSGVAITSASQCSAVKECICHIGCTHDNKVHSIKFPWFGKIKSSCSLAELNRTQARLLFCLTFPSISGKSLRSWRHSLPKSPIKGIIFHNRGPLLCNSVPESSHDRARSCPVSRNQHRCVALLVIVGRPHPFTFRRVQPQL